MDKEQARFILRSFRPDGSDCSDPEFAEALKLAHQDLELGQWLAGQRAFDAAFAHALSEVKLPVALCKNILTGLAIERGDIPQATDPLDATMIGALASIQPPPALRGEVLAAMRSTASAVRAPVFRWRRMAIPLAAAAGIALAFVVIRRQEPPVPEARNSSLPVEFVEAGFISAYESPLPLFKPDETGEDQNAMIKILKARKLPCPCCLPRGLAGVKGIGCREWVVDGKYGSLICFDRLENGVVHLVVFRREDVSGELPQRQSPSFSEYDGWAVARWGDDERVFVLLGKGANVTQLAALF
ncbi:MAG: hypothetical protein NTW21_01500 [Verrucomicrobia bacterium]|nr:hypothetical protein [Verrucomicrobiota bacterium]